MAAMPLARQSRYCVKGKQRAAIGHSAGTIGHYWLVNASFITTKTTLIYKQKYRINKTNVLNGESC